MSSSAFNFYRAHVIFVKISEPAQWHLIPSGKTIVVYLQIHFFVSSLGSKLEIEVIWTPRKHLLESVYALLPVVLQPVFGDGTHGLTGFKVTRMGEQNLTVQLSIESYVAELSDA